MRKKCEVGLLRDVFPTFTLHGDRVNANVRRARWMPLGLWHGGSGCGRMSLGDALWCAVAILLHELFDALQVELVEKVDLAPGGERNSG